MFNRILVGVDGGEGGRDAIALATQLAEPEAEVVLAHICGAGLMPGRGAELLLSAEIEKSQRLLQSERESASIDAELAIWAAHKVGRGLHELAEHRDADLLVVGSCRRGVLGRVFLGNDMIESLNGAPCAVAIAPQGYAATLHGFQSVGVGSDGSPQSEQAVARARDIANRFGAKVTALAVVSLQSIPYGEPVPENWPEFAKRLMDSERRRLDGLEDVEGEVSYGEPSEELARFGQDLDLLVVGSRGYGPFGRLINGSTSNYLACRARCPLLVLPRGAARTEEVEQESMRAEVGR